MLHPLHRILDNVIKQAIEQKAAEIYLEPMADKLAVRYLTENGLHDAASLPKHIHAAWLDRYKDQLRPTLLQRLAPKRRRYWIWNEEMEHDLGITVCPTPHGQRVAIKLIRVGRKGRWLRREERLMGSVGWWLKDRARELGSFVLSLLRLFGVVLPSVLLAMLGLPFGRPFFYWEAKYWGIAANLSGRQLSHEDLAGSNLACANLDAADLSHACLRNATLIDANLTNANLQGACLQRAVLMNAKLQGADLRGADLQEAVFSNADLRDARLNAADLRGAYLSRWWTIGGVWTGCERGADLRGTDLAGANLTGTQYDNTTSWPEGFDPVKRGAVNRDRDCRELT